MPNRYTFTREYDQSAESYNGHEVLGVASGELDEDIACVVPQCHGGAFWVTVHLHVCPHDCAQ